MGSSNYITNIAGEVSQHTEYFAFGETFVEEHKGSNNSPYKFNCKELDEESGLYYYGARYYDPRISIWTSVDPLAEQFAGRSSYEYCFSNPLNLTDPTGMCPDNPKSGEPPLKNIYIVLDYNPTADHGKDADRDTIEFKNMKRNGWYGIYANNITDANNQLKTYLSDSEADNIVLENHGLRILKSDGSDSGKRAFSTDNNNNTYITTTDLSNSISGQNTKNQTDVDAMIGIIEKVSKGGNFYLKSCNTADEDNFFNNLQTLTNNRVNIFGNADICRTTTNPIGGGHSIYNFDLIKLNAIFPQDYEMGSKLYQSGCSGEVPITLKNIQLNRQGIKPIF